MPCCLKKELGSRKASLPSSSLLFAWKVFISQKLLRSFFRHASFHVDLEHAIEARAIHAGLPQRQQLRLFGCKLSNLSEAPGTSSQAVFMKPNRIHGPQHRTNALNALQFPPAAPYMKPGCTDQMQDERAQQSTGIRAAWLTCACNHHKPLDQRMKHV